jgi:processive 1,2-diacylglycerol beta-glucosyltransferase
VGSDNADLVPVFRTEDLALLPLAKLALESERIEYLVRGPGLGAEWTHATLGASSRNAGWIEIVVASDEAARARDVLGDLPQLEPVASPPGGGVTSPVPAPAAGTASVQLNDLDSGLPLGSISDSDLQCLIDRLEEDASQPRSYYIDAPTVELLEQSGASADLVSLLRRAIGGRDGVQIQWTRADDRS